MYIRKIHIEDIRGLEKVDLDLDRGEGKFAGWTVIAGRNGSGKSTLLKAIALAVAGPKRVSSLQRSFVEWIRSGEKKAEVELHLAPDSVDSARGDDFVYFKVSLGWLDIEIPRVNTTEHIRPIRSSREPGILSSISTVLNGASEEDSSGGIWSENPRGWFIAGYGAHRRLSSRDDGERNQPTMVARLEGLFDEDVTFSDATRWLRKIHALGLDYANRADRDEKEFRPDAAASNRAQSEQFAQVLRHLLRLLNDGPARNRLLPEGHEVTEINQEGVWVKSRDVLLPLQSLGDGYKTVIGLVVDIARHLHECYGDFSIIEENGQASVALAGVVLIDEVEAHLHVEWQQRIGFWLKQHFPFIQFIVTTHSPFICQAADKKGLIRLPAPGSGKPAEHVSDEEFLTIVNGGPDEATLTALFGLEHPHSEASEKLRTEVAELEVRVIRGRATEEEKARLERLSAELPATGSDLVEQAVRKLEALGEKA